jgi:hypothetical protein
MTLTATADTEAPIVPPAEPAVVAVPERPVFAATTPTRPRALKLAGRVTAGLVGLWLVALVLGTFGFGPVAGIGLPRIGGGSSQPHRQAHKTPAQQPGERVTRSGVTLTTRSGGATTAPATRHGSGPSSASRRAASRQGSGSDGAGGNSGVRSGSPTSGGSRGVGATPGSNSGTTGGGTSVQTPSTTPSGTATSTPTASTPTNGNTTHSNATPPGSSSTAPGSRSNAGTAPGREQSASSPSPGSGRTEHAPSTG